MPITPTTRKPTNRAKAAHLYNLIADAAQTLSFPDLMAIKNGGEWDTLPPSVRAAFEDIAAKL